MLKSARGLPKVELVKDCETLELKYYAKIFKKNNCIVITSQIINDELFSLKIQDFKLRLITTYRDINQVDTSKIDEFNIKEFWIEESFIHEKVAEFKMFFGI